MFKKAPPPDRVIMATAVIERHASTLSMYHVISMLYMAGYNTMEIQSGIRRYLNSNEFATPGGHTRPGQLA